MHEKITIIKSPIPNYDGITHQTAANRARIDLMRPGYNPMPKKIESNLNSEDNNMEQKISTFDPLPISDRLTLINIEYMTQFLREDIAREQSVFGGNLLKLLYQRRKLLDIEKEVCNRIKDKNRITTNHKKQPKPETCPHHIRNKQCIWG
jgi:hypothetical protein